MKKLKTGGVENLNADFIFPKKFQAVLLNHGAILFKNDLLLEAVGKLHGPVTPHKGTVGFS